MTIGLVSACEPNVIRLDAGIFARDGTLLYRYQFSKKVRASMLDNCALPDEYSHSKHLRGLLKELLRQIKADKSL
ncbi:MAG: hypothetical protein OEV63_14575 [Gammaproteobacteria bacterium]|nr:hypothetical protein [Gammaproteobacteria bacterium]